PAELIPLKDLQAVIFRQSPAAPCDGWNRTLRLGWARLDSPYFRRSGRRRGSPWQPKSRPILVPPRELSRSFLVEPSPRPIYCLANIEMEPKPEYHFAEIEAKW